MMINGFKIERREHNGHVYYVVFNELGFNKFYSLEDAVKFAASMA